MSKLYFRSAAMNAGKSTALLQVAHNCRERGLAVLLFTAAQDDRAGAGQIGSRLGLVRPAVSLGADTEFNRARLQALAGGPVACVLVDEAQFLTAAQVRQLHRRAHVEGRRIKQGEQVVVRGNDRCRAVCPACFYSDEDAGVVAPVLFG